MEKNYKSSLTLLELITAIMILSLIVGVFIPAGFNYTKSKYISYTKEEMDLIKEALLEFYRDLDQFPKQLADLETNPGTSGFYAAASWRASKWDGPYIQDKFGDDGYLRDSWNTNYSYTYNYTADPTSCTLTSYGPDRISGTSDDIVYVVNAYDIKREKIENVQDELELIKKAAQDYTLVTGNYPTSIDDLFEWEILNLHMDEPSWDGTSGEVKDYSGMGNYGTSYNGATTADGKIGMAGSFDGLNDYVYVPDDDSLRPTQFSIELWVKSDDAFGATRRFDIVDLTSYVIIRNDERATYGRNLAFHWYDGRWYAINPTFTPEAGEWYYIVATHDGITAKLYVNGRLEASLNAGFTLSSSQAGVSIGAHRWASANYFDGLIDDLRIYKIVLSPDEILRRYENPGSPPSYSDLHDYSLKYDEWENTYAIGSSTVNGQTVYYFYSYGPDREDDNGADDDIKPRGL